MLYQQTVERIALQPKLTTGTLIVLTCLLLTATGSKLSAQITATPARINLTTATPLPTSQLLTATPTRTPTPIGLVVLEAITEANVRADPDPESERLGTIRAGEIYPVVGRYFRWLQFQYEPSPNGRGWVFDELVTVVGDQSTIRDLTVQDVSTADPAVLAITQTSEAITLTPGGILTATENAKAIAAPSVEFRAQTEHAGSTIALPTFTYPPNIVRPESGGFAALEPTTSPNVLADENTGGLPPIVPIAVLGGIGLVGLLVSSLRR
jgi:hypothetical protein